MAEKTSKQSGPQRSNRDANFGTHAGGINPAAPSAGTAGWGTTSDERSAIADHDLDATRAGQMKGNPGDDMATASQRASDAATTNKRRSEDADSSQADPSRRTSASAHSMSQSDSKSHTFRCTDAGNTNCRWETSGKTEDEVLQKIVEHVRNDHGMTDWTDAMHDRVRHAIHQRRAA